MNIYVDSILDSLAVKGVKLLEIREAQDEDPLAFTSHQTLLVITRRARRSWWDTPEVIKNRSAINYEATSTEQGAWRAPGNSQG